MHSTIAVADLVYHIKTTSWVWLTLNAALLPIAHAAIMNLRHPNKKNWKERSKSLCVSKSVCLHTKDGLLSCFLGRSAENAEYYRVLFSQAPH